MKFKVVNKFRFITFLTVCILLIAFSISALCNVATAQRKQEYKTVEVMYGDTLWEIAKTYGDPDKDVREVIYDICKINNVNASSLKAGMEIKVPAN